MTAAVILAAGAGSRLGELGKRHSKAMLPVAGRPLIDWVIDRLCAAGIEDLVVVGHARDDALADHLRSERPAAALVRQHERRGIADALLLAQPALESGEAYLACACDSVFDTEDIAALIAAGRREPRSAVIGVLEMGADATASRSAVRTQGDRVVEIVEKPSPGSIASGLVSMPLYWLPPSFAPYLEHPPAQGEHYVSSALASFIADGGRLLAHRVARRIEITRPEDIPVAEAALHS